MIIALLSIIIILLILNIFKSFIFKNINSRNNNKKFNTPIERVEYSNKVLDYINELTIHISILKYDKFINTRDPELITRETLKNLMSSIAEDVNKYIIKDNINLDDTFISEECYNEYIISTIIYIINQEYLKTLNKTLNQK